MDDKICGYYLDKQQEEIVFDDSKYLLVVAGAGSGKTLTILGKINYLIKYKKVLPNEILCISFTRASANSLKEKIKKEFNLDLPVYTFHKLSMDILKEKESFNVADTNTLDHIIHHFLYIDILSSNKHMDNILNYFKVKRKKDIKEQYLEFCSLNSDKIELLEHLLLTFIKLFKCNHYSLIDFKLFLKKAKRIVFYRRYKKEKIILNLALNIYLVYEEYLFNNNEIDFDDIIIKASEYVNKYGINNKYKYVIIDEYQDTSYIRFLLVKSILEKTGAHFMVVGDDFQSIYRFTGCDVSLFLDFNKYFNSAKIRKIENTYRNSKELISVAGSFVMKNKRQIKKRLNSNKHISKPIEIVYYKDIKEAFILLVQKIYEDNRKPIMILGRNNNDINMIISKKIKLDNSGKVIYIENKDIEMYYLTSHKSKGLEEENVIIINLIDKLLGFPNKIIDDKVLGFVSCKDDKYPYSEERRLFYVALTRTKNKVYLLVPRKNPSIFVRELLANYRSKITISTSL